MRRAVLYITMFFALCFGFKAQSQNAVTEYDVKLNSLQNSSREILNNLINGPQSSAFVNDDQQPKIYVRSGEQVNTLFVKKPTDFTLVSNDYTNEINTVKVLNIEWNGSDVFNFPNNLLSILPNLEYVYVRSYQNLSKQTIETNFQGLLALLSSKSGVEVLYLTMEQPQ